MIRSFVGLRGRMRYARIQFIHTYTTNRFEFVVIRGKVRRFITEHQRAGLKVERVTREWLTL